MGVAIDTNLLLLLWIGGFNPDLVGRFKRTKKYGFADFELLRALVNELDRLVVTPHVLTEVSNFAGQLPEETCHAFRSAIVQVVREAVERVVPAATLADSVLFPRLGLTDVALHDAARSGVLIVTDDLPLHVELSRSKLPSLNFTHLRAALYQ
jgi:hypothetical protein